MFVQWFKLFTYFFFDIFMYLTAETTKVETLWSNTLLLLLAHTESTANFEKHGYEPLQTDSPTQFLPLVSDS